MANDASALTSVLLLGVGAYIGWSYIADNDVVSVYKISCSTSTPQFRLVDADECRLVAGSRWTALEYNYRADFERQRVSERTPLFIERYDDCKVFDGESWHCPALGERPAIGMMRGAMYTAASHERIVGYLDHLLYRWGLQKR